MQCTRLRVRRRQTICCGEPCREQLKENKDMKPLNIADVFNASIVKTEQHVCFCVGFGYQKRPFKGKEQLFFMSPLNS